MFTRPSILLPSVYYETQGARALLFASDGVQGYGGFAWGDHYTSVAATYSLIEDMDEPREERVLGNYADQGELRLDHFYSARLQDESGGGRWTSALSYLHGSMEFDPGAGVASDFSFEFDLYILSARYSGERFGLTTEYSLIQSQGAFMLPPGPAFVSDDTGDSAYIQGDYFLDPEWTLSARWDSSFMNRDDRDGDQCAGARHECFAHDFMVGAGWKSLRHWGAWAEYHVIDGTATASARDNVPPLEGHWSVLMLMAAYRF
jgi:hypothetical protein